jgi:hypothetical protein
MTQTPKTEAVVIPIMEDCEFCDNGMRTYPPVYIDGDLYQDGEVMECSECGGSGKVKAEGGE